MQGLFCWRQIMGKENLTIFTKNIEPVRFTVVRPGPEQRDLAKIVSSWTSNAGNMLPKSPDEIQELFADRHSIVILHDGDPMSHAAATFVYSSGSVEVGAVFTAEKYRNHGAATRAVKETISMLRAEYPGQTIFALANPLSAGLFEKIGGRKMKHDELSTEVWEPCATCPKKPLKKEGVIFQCCDTPYDLTNIGQ